MKLSLLALVGLTLVAAAPRPVSDRAPVVSEADPTHTITIEYQQRRGDLRQASLKIVIDDSLPPRTRAPWRGALHSVSVLSKDGRWIVIRNLRQSRGEGIQADALLPAPENVVAIVLKPMRGPMLSWNVGEGRNYTEIEWTYFNQNGRTINPGDLRAQNDETPESPEEPKDPPSDDGGGGDDDEGCQGTGGCTGIVDPWTCECSEDVRDPWEDEVQSNAIMLSI